VQFSDADAHEVTSTLAFTMTCGGLPACNSQCGELRCAAEGNQCVGTGGGPISDAQLCSFCNSGCQACSAGCACFDEAPSCSGGSDCLLTINDANQVTQAQCTANGGPSLRDDGFVVWSVGGRSLPTFFNRFGGVGGLFDDLCEPFGGLSDAREESLPAELANGQAVLGVEEGCALENLAACEPLIGSAAVVGRRGDKLTCVNPIGEPVDPNLGNFGQACRANGTCAGDMECNGSNICVESCFSDFDCGSCNFDNGPGACTCDTFNGLCRLGGGGGTDFSCAGTRTISTGSTISQTGSTSGQVNSINPSCGSSTSGDQAWRFTPTTTGTYHIQTTGFDTVLHVRSECGAGATELACNDTGVDQFGSALAGDGSSVQVSLTANVPVLIVVDGFSTNTGSYTLTIIRR
jgi:hypothetical protein